jgi:hypothetical protein
VPSFSCALLLSAWLAFYSHLVLVSWDLVQSPALPQFVLVVLWPTAYYPSFLSGSPSSLCLRLFSLSLFGPSSISWALGILKAMFLPTLPLRLLSFPTSLG